MLKNIPTVTTTKKSNPIFRYFRLLIIYLIITTNKILFFEHLILIIKAIQVQRNFYHLRLCVYGRYRVISCSIEIAIAVAAVNGKSAIER